MGHTKRWCRFDSGNERSDRKNKNNYVYKVFNVNNIHSESAQRSGDEESSSSDRKSFVELEEGKRLKKNTEDIRQYKHAMNHKRRLIRRYDGDDRDFGCSKEKFEMIKREFKDVLDLEEQGLNFVA